MSNSYLLERKRLFQSFAAISNDNEFWQLTRAIHKFQLKYNPLFNEYHDQVAQNYSESEFTYLPISFFKSHKIKSGHWKEETRFSSSGTSGVNSIHQVKNKKFYLKNASIIFQKTYGSLNDYCFVCLLPSYLEREGSSLITMCDHFIKESQIDNSAFYLYDHDKLFRTLTKLKKLNQKTILIGVSYALLDFVESNNIDWSQLIVIKTGGMKGRREEMNSSELDSILKVNLGVDFIHAEYGMTECFSQLYSQNGQSYSLNLHMKAKISDMSDPFHMVKKGKSGRINIIDLANIDTVSFIATDDVGYINEKNELVVLGRIDNSDLRGCNMLL